MREEEGRKEAEIQKLGKEKKRKEGSNNAMTKERNFTTNQCKEKEERIPG